MRTSLTIFVALMIVSVLAFTGFQCGSAELTSARLYLQQKEYARAEESLIREVQKNPSHEDAWFLLGQVRLEMKKYIEANQAYDKALALSDVHKKEIQQNKLALWSQFYKEGIDLYNEGMDDNTKYHTAL
jgi:cytochrome c-type biogenesis protein CcmH/NrfG